MSPRLKVLLVEDSPLTRHMVRRMLEQHGGYQVLEAVDGETALAILESQPVHLVLSDLHMAPMDGHQLRHHIRATPHLCHLPFIMMTGQHSPDAIHHTVRDPCSRYLAKPFCRDQLFLALELTVPLIVAA